MTTFYLPDALGFEGLLRLASQHGLALNSEAVQYACRNLNDEWLILVDAGWPNCICSLSMSAGQGSIGLALSQWIDLVDSFYVLRDTNGISEQARRLNILSHERLDTALVMVVAARYKKKGWRIAFEPNGRGCSDLRVDKDDRRLYIEVKRENLQSHYRYKTFSENAKALLDRIHSSLGEWLDHGNLRIEVKLSRGFSQSVVEKIHAELTRKAPKVPLHTEQDLSIPSNSRFVVLRTEEPYYAKGFSVGRITIKQSGVAVQVHPKNMPVRIVFEWPPNFIVVARLIREARRQLANDAKVDPPSTGFVVVQASGAPALAQVIEKRLLSSLTRQFLGVVFLPEAHESTGQIICSNALEEETVQAMSHAAGVS